jgi:starch-binding outer membrane protein, SusD/RagB family
MKQYIKILTVAAGLALAVTSCKKQLNVLPTDQIDISKAFTSVADVEKGLLGVYAANNLNNKAYIGSILADEAKISNENRGQGQSEFKWQFVSTTGGVTDSYRRNYTLIDRIHRVAIGANNVTPADAAEGSRLQLVKDELNALKAMAYYETLIYVMPPGYNAAAPGLALVNETCLTCTPARNSVGDVVAEIERLLGLARASTLIPNAPTGNAIKLCKAVIATYQARVALLKRAFPAAATFASDAITFSGKTLPTTPSAMFSPYWSDANESESIFKFRNQVTPQLSWRDTNGDVFFEPSDKLKALFDRTNDTRFATYFGAIGTDTSNVIKYKGSTFGATINDLKLIRLAELYLIRAEANAEANQLLAAANDLNALRKARITGYVDQTFTVQQTLIDAVVAERSKELCFEGFRFFDLKRKGLPINRLASDVQSLAWQNLPAGDYRFTLPIPQDAINANPNTTQNPGY